MAGCAVDVPGSPPHLVHVFATFEPFGPQVRTAALINYFGARFRHTVTALDGRTGARRLIAPQLDVGVIGPPERARLLPQRLVRLRAWLRLLRPDLILTYGAATLEVALANRWRAIAPLVHHEDGCPGERVSGAAAMWRRLVLPGAHAVVVPSPALERVALRRWGLARDRVRRIANGVDVARFGGRPEPGAIPGFERQPGELIVGTVTSLHALEPLERLLGAFASARHGANARLVLVGDGPARGDLIRTLVERDLAPRVVLPGRLGPPEDLLGHFDVFAVSCDQEQMPLAVIEAMAAGLPVVGVEANDLASMVSEPNREFIVDPDNEAAFAAKLDALLRDDQLRRRLGRANREKAAADFDFQRMAEAYGRLFDAGIGQVGVGAPRAEPAV